MNASGPKRTPVRRASNDRSQPEADTVAPAFALAEYDREGGLRTLAAGETSYSQDAGNRHWFSCSQLEAGAILRS